MSFTHEDVQRIIQLLNDSHFDELHLEADGIKLDLRRNGAGAPSAAGRAPAQLAAATPVPAASNGSAASSPSVSSSSTSSSSATPVSTPSDAAAGAGLLDIRAPMLGAFYRAPKPGAEPFVSVGSRVSPDTVIGIIEVMKLMNSVSAGVGGEIVEILGKDGDLVEYDQVLVRVRPD